MGDVANLSTALLEQIYGSHEAMHAFGRLVVSRAMGKAGSGVTTITLTDASYARAFLNFVHVTTNVSATTPAVLALDAETKCAMDHLGVAVVRVWRPAGWDRDRWFLVLKTHPIMMALERGVRVIFSEMDCFWLRDPLDWLQIRVVSEPKCNGCREPADMLVEQHRFERLGEPNYGFFIVNSTIETIRWCRGLLSWALSEHFESKMDQKVWYFALAGVNNKTEGDTYRAGGIAESALQHRLRFNHIPYEALPHFGRFNGGPKIRTADIHFVRSHAPFAIHMWGDAGQQRIGKAAQMGSLFIDDVSTAGGCNHTSNYT